MYIISVYVFMSSAKVDSPPRPVYSNRFLPRPLRPGKADGR